MEGIGIKKAKYNAWLSHLDLMVFFCIYDRFLMVANAILLNASFDDIIEDSNL